jgi:hypothetical protein
MAVKTSQKNNTITGATSFTKVRGQMDAVLSVLYVQPNKEVNDPSGRATQKLRGMMPPGFGMERTNFSRLLRRMENEGWLSRKLNQKMLYSIKLVRQPKDWDPSPVTWLDQPVEVVANGDTHTDEVPEPTVSEDPTLDDEAREGDIRPGRLARRLESLESSIAPQVETAVAAGIQGFFTQLAVSLGFEKPLPSDNANIVILDLNDRLTDAQQAISVLQDDLRAERISNSAAREELNRVLRTKYSTRDSDQVPVSALPESYRGLGRHAEANGWKLYRTSGGHFMWKAPNGERYYTSSTPSDVRGVRNSRSDMEKMGLPKE